MSGSSKQQQMGTSKKEELGSNPARLVLRLADKISSKLTALGYSKRESNEHLLNLINPVIKHKNAHFRNLHRWLAQRLENEQHHKNTLYKLAAELEFYLNSIHDNYDSESPEPEPAFLKCQHLVAAESANKPLECQDKKNEGRARYMSPGERRQVRGRERRELTTEDYLEEVYRRRCIEKANRRKEVKLEYLSTLNY